MDSIETKQNSLAVTEKDVNISALGRMWDYGYSPGGEMPDRPTQPYAQSSWVYICVNTIIAAARSIQMMLSTNDDKVVESGPAYDLLFNNSSMPFSKFLTDTAGYLALWRECYWVYLDKDITKPTSLLIVGPEQLKPVVRRGTLVGYKLHQPGQIPVPLFIDDVYPLRDFNPYHNFHGVGPASAGELPISSSYQAALLNESTMANGGFIGTLITTPGKLDGDEKRSLISQFEARHKGARNAGKTCLMTGGADVKKLSQTMKELEIIKLREFDAKEICSLFGVPPEIVGLATEAKYANGPAQQRFISNTIDSLLSFVAEHITGGLLDKFKHRKHSSVDFAKSKSFCGKQLPLASRPSHKAAKIKAIQAGQSTFAWFAIEEHPAIQVMLRERAEKVLEFTKAGVLLNNLIDAYDLPFEQTDAGNHWWIPMSLAPAKWTLDAGPEGMEQPPLPEGETDDDDDDEGDDKTIKSAEPDMAKLTPQQKLRIWNNWKKSWSGIEREFEGAVRTFFIRQRRQLTEKLKAALAAEGKSVKDAANIIARVVFDLRVEDKKIKVINSSFFEKASELGIRQGLTETAGLSGKELNEAVQQIHKLTPLQRRAIVTSSHKITRINRTTQKLVSKKLRAGLESGEGLGKLTSRISSVMDTSRGRALSIARTQTTGAIGTGRHDGLKHGGTEKHTWLDSQDNNVRNSHSAAAAKYARGIPVDQAFEVEGEFLMYPGDPMGSAGNIANCRCIELPIAAGKMSGSPIHKNANFYLYEQMKKDKEL